MSTTNQVISTMEVNNTTIYSAGNWSTSGPTFYHYEYVPANISERVRLLLAQPNTIIALTLGFVAISLNVLSILAITKIHSGLTSHYRLIVSLAISDILIGLSVVLHIINNVFNPRPPKAGIGPWPVREQSFCVFIIIKALNTTSLNITLLNLMGMAIDLFLAIVRPLHYPSLMNKQRATITIAFFWFVAILCGFSDFFSTYPKFKKYTWKYHFCEFVYLTKYQEEYPTFAIALVCFFIMSFVYLRILIAVKRRHQNIPIRTELQRNKKALFTTLLILFTFIICWLPMCLFQIILIIQVKVNPMGLHKVLAVLTAADQYLYDLMLLNCIFDPIIYAIRMPEVQLGYRKLFRLCCKRPIKDSRRMSSTDVTHCAMLVDERKVSKISLGSIRLKEQFSVKKPLRKNNSNSSHSPTANNIANHMKLSKENREESVV